MGEVTLLPFVDFVGMTTWFLGFLLVTLLPGYGLVGRHLRDQDVVTRAYCSIAAGICAVTMAGLLLTVMRIPIAWPSVLIFLFIAGAASHWSTAWRQSLEEIAGSIPRASALQNVLVITSVLVLASVMQVAFRDFAASPHLHDASNHSFLVKRIMESRSMAMSQLFAEPYALPRFDYLAGWHVNAALISSITWTKPFISAWYFAVACAALLPMGLMLAWRLLGVAPTVAALACLVAISNYYTPTNIFSWGGYGQIVGLFLAPWVFYLTREMYRGTRLTIALLCGLHLVALLHIHGSEIYLVVVLALLSLPCVQRPPDWQWRALIRSLAVSFGLLVSLGILPLSLASYEFAVSGSAAPSATARTFGETLELLRTFAVGNTHQMSRLAIPMLVFGFLATGFRRFAFATTATAIVFISLEIWADPVSLALTKPMYHHSARLAYWFIFFVPVLYAGTLWYVIRLIQKLPTPGLPIAARVMPVLAWLLLPVLAFTHLWPGVYWSYRGLVGKQVVVAFDEDDARLAARMAAELPVSAIVANQNDDGSYWFMHATGLRFLDPTSWRLGARDETSWRPHVDGLARSPWSDAVLLIREAGVEYYLVSDTLLRGAQAQVTRAQLQADERFKAVMVGASTTLFRIRWEAGDPGS